MKSFESKIAIVIVLIIGLLQFSACSSSEVNESQGSFTKVPPVQSDESENSPISEETPEVDNDIAVITTTINPNTNGAASFTYPRASLPFSECLVR